MRNLLALTFCFVGTITWAANTSYFLRKMPVAQRAELNDIFSKRTSKLIAAYSSGDIVGNGGGLIEQNLSFAYSSVLSIIDTCVIYMDCKLTPNEKLVLLDIRATYFSKLDNELHFVFLREKDAPGLFHDDLDPGARVAKTGFSKDFPIFINLDQLETNLDLAYDLGSMLGIVIHELGHQTGYPSHSKLDAIAAKLRVSFNYKMRNTEIKLDDNFLTVNIYNKDEALRTQVSYYYNNQLRFLSYPIEKELKCEHPNRDAIGYSLSNQHWDRLVKAKDLLRPRLNMWIDIHCEDSDGVIFTEERDLKIDFLINKNTKKLIDHKITIE